VHAAGLPAFRSSIATAAPFVGARVDEIADWDQVKLLTVAVDHLKQWHRPGLICLGDSAHAMSPIGGVGINLAIQDAVAAGNMLARPLKERRLRDEDLARLQKRREWPARMTQRAQVLVQNRIITPTLSSTAPLKPPLIARLFQRFPVLQRLPARLVGIGLRPEHVRPQ
jgi:2-polyprenyl-6-methoxyphenol hydroxylase-like FAD-dependent oxidoreductase